MTIDHVLGFSVLLALVVAPVLFGALFAYANYKTRNGLSSDVDLIEISMMMDLTIEQERELFADRDRRRAEYEARKAGGRG